MPGSFPAQGRAKRVGGEAVIRRADPVYIANGLPLVVGNRNKGSIWKAPDYLRQAWQIQTPVECREKGHSDAMEQRQMQPVDMSMDHVEFGSMLRHDVQQNRLRCNRVSARPAKAKRMGPN